MNPGPLLYIAYKIFKKNSGEILNGDTVQEWIATNGNRENIGSGYSGGRLSASGTGGFAELVRENRGGSVRVTAAIIFDQRSGPFARTTWDAKKLDAKLEKMFGNNLRVRINV